MAVASVASVPQALQPQFTFYEPDITRYDPVTGNANKDIGTVHMSDLRQKLEKLAKEWVDTAPTRDRLTASTTSGVKRKSQDDHNQTAPATDNAIKPPAQWPADYTEDEFLSRVAESQKQGVDFEDTTGKWKVSTAGFGVNPSCGGRGEDRLGFHQWIGPDGVVRMTGIGADGHGGRFLKDKGVAATLATQRWGPIVQATFEEATGKETDLELFESALKRLAKEVEHREDGACTTTSLFLPDKLLVGSCGDAEVAIVRRSASGKTTIKSIFDAHTCRNYDELTRMLQTNMAAGRDIFEGLSLNSFDPQVDGYQPSRALGDKLGKESGLLIDEFDVAEVPYEDEDGTIVKVIHTSDGMEKAYSGFEDNLDRETQWQHGLEALDASVSAKGLVEDTTAARLLLHALGHTTNKGHKETGEPVWSLRPDHPLARGYRDDTSFGVIELVGTEPSESTPDGFGHTISRLDATSVDSIGGSIGMTVPTIAAC